MRELLTAFRAGKIKTQGDANSCGR
jgi:hypothetical protein